MEEYDLFGNKISKSWGGKRENAGRPTIKEKRRILEAEKLIKNLYEKEKHFLELPEKKRGSHLESSKIVQKLANIYHL